MRAEGSGDLFHKVIFVVKLQSPGSAIPSNIHCFGKELFLYIDLTKSAFMNTNISGLQGVTSQ